MRRSSVLPPVELVIIVPLIVALLSVRVRHTVRSGATIFITIFSFEPYSYALSVRSLMIGRNCKAAGRRRDHGLWRVRWPCQVRLLSSTWLGSS
ncbi:hypothetical protein AHF37_12068 [Paragonimus kellicotti]|nr:hypothetical protein AHF37_12068 [Paragonimus kellicotti]